MEVKLSAKIRILFTVYSLLKQHLELLIDRKEEVLQSNIIQMMLNSRPQAQTGQKQNHINYVASLWKRKY